MEFTAIFGAGYAGLTTVGYTLYNADGSLNRSRTTSGVAETSTPGTYTADIILPLYFSGTITWDTGGADPAEASETYNDDRPVVEPYALTDLATVKVYTGTTYSDAEIQLAINTVSREIENYCNRMFNPADYSIKLNGSGRQALVLPQFPVLSVTSIVMDEVAVAAADYEIDSGAGILYHDYRWTKGARNITIVYRAGYTTIPPDISMIATKMAVDHLQRLSRDISLKSETLSKHSWTAFTNAEMTTNYNVVLSHYKRYIV
ncbi:MAG: hypothetical protein ACYC27_18690 [Armatimonadota bacterium]